MKKCPFSGAQKWDFKRPIFFDRNDDDASQMKEADKALTGMEKWCGLFVCPWNKFVQPIVIIIVIVINIVNIVIIIIISDDIKTFVCPWNKLLQPFIIIIILFQKCLESFQWKQEKEQNPLKIITDRLLYITNPGKRHCRTQTPGNGKRQEIQRGFLS